jgi:dolichol-phosphate mannosyltransferase
MNSSPISISVIMPAYNEELSIRSAVCQNIETFSSRELDFEILIIDDKSIDGTRKLGDELAKEFPSVHCFHHQINEGPGGAFRTGVKKATKEFLIFVPFDNPLTVGDLDGYLPRLGVCDIIVGVRVARVGYSAIAHFASFFYNRIMIPLLFNVGISDVNWIQIYRRCYFEDGTLNISNTRIFFLVEILVQAKEKQLIVAEIPSRMKKRLYGMPTCSRFSTMWVTFFDAMRFFWKIHK